MVIGIVFFLLRSVPPVYAATTLSSTKVGATATIQSVFSGRTWLCDDKSPRVASRIRLISNTLINDGKTATDNPLRINLTDSHLDYLLVNGKSIPTALHEQRYANADQMKRSLVEYDLTPPIAITTNDTVSVSFSNIRIVSAGLVNAQVSFETDRNKDWGCVQDKTTKFLLSESGSGTASLTVSPLPTRFLTATPYTNEVNREFIPTPGHSAPPGPPQSSRGEDTLVARILNLVIDFLSFFNPIKKE